MGRREREPMRRSACLQRCNAVKHGKTPNVRCEVEVDFAKVRVNFLDTHKVTVRLGEQITLADNVVDPSCIALHFAQYILRGGAIARGKAARAGGVSGKQGSGAVRRALRRPRSVWRFTAHARGTCRHIICNTHTHTRTFSEWRLNRICPSCWCILADSGHDSTPEVKRERSLFRVFANM